VGTGLDPARVRACAGLGDGEGAATLALAARDEVVAFLRLGAEAQGIGGVPNDRPERAGGLAEFLAHQHLLEDREALSAVLARMVDAVEAVLDDGPAQPRQGLRRQMAVELQLLLLREEPGLRELLRLALQREVGFRDGKVHGVRPAWE